MSLMIATPLKWKLKGGNSKYILRKLVEKKVIKLHIEKVWICCTCMG